MSQVTEWRGRHRAKDVLRHEIWTTLKALKATHRDPSGHIPNFVGAEAAATRLASLAVWQHAQVIKCNPDSPQKPVRLKALKDGKLLYMAVPRLAKSQCFVALHRDTLAAQDTPLETAANMRGALRYGTLVAFETMQPIDLVIVGCVAVAANGGRTGKGAGFADVELALLREWGLVKAETPILTTVHPLQVVADDRLPMQPHDWPLDWIMTPEKTIATHTTLPRPTGLDWETLQPDQLQKIPVLRSLAQQHQFEV
ncbi:MAG: 5-formyltetrahydrofolate cyclo-ligase [Leptolyngbya sp. SIO1D8]|nr:5-formyltetrahydrofolate cyclo-ligase [Leptolyngbya sp. SIO1D8]